MRVKVLVPEESLANRYPKRTIVTDIEVDDASDVIEELEAPAGAWLIVFGDDRIWHYEASDGKWKFRSKVLV